MDTVVYNEPKLHSHNHTNHFNLVQEIKDEHIARELRKHIVEHEVITFLI